MGRVIGRSERTRRFPLPGRTFRAAAVLAALAVLGAAAPASAQTLTWSVVPSPSYLFSSGLSAVSCVSAAACTAVGDAHNNSSAYQTLIESWNGARWSVVPSPSPGADGNRLFGVSCVSPAACTAVGYSFTRSGEGTLVESWNGASWSVVPSPSPGADGSSLSGVSCVSAAACTAVGAVFTSSVNQTLVESWNGTSWSVVPSPSPGADGSDLSGVSCVSAAACTAVGSMFPSSTEQANTLVESWNGTRWSRVPSPNGGPNAATSDLAGVSCVSVAACTAVGSTLSYTAQHSKTLVESWNGTRWSRVPSPSPGAGGNDLSGVSCVSVALCTAVGDHSKPGSRAGLNTLIESWNGTRWSVVPSPNPLGFDFLKAASCISATACTAVGSSAKGPFKPATKTLIESGTASG